MSGFIGNGPNGVGRFSRFQFTASAGQATYGGTDKNGLTLRYTPGQVEVILDGSWLSPDDYTATDGSTIALVRGANAGDTLYVFAPTNFGVADSISYLSQQALSSSQQALARANIGVSRRNYIINGAMMVSQENGAVAGAATGYYPVDQFFLTFGGTTGACSAAQVAAQSPAGSPNRLRVTVTTADAVMDASDNLRIIQKIEGLRVADLLLGTVFAKGLTVQFGVKAPAGTYGLALRNATPDRAGIGTFTIAPGEANTDVVKSVTFPGDTSGTWAKDTSVGLQVEWILMAGSGFQTNVGWQSALSVMTTSAQFNFMGTNGNVFELFDVGLYEGATAPTFQVPDFTAELLLCRRYWEKSYEYPTAPGTATFVGQVASYKLLTGTDNTSLAIIQYQPKRATPTVQTYSPNTGASGKARDNAGGADIVPNIDQIGMQSTRFYAGLTNSNMYFHWTINARL